MDALAAERIDALDGLRRLIGEEGYGAGDRLPPERELIRRFGVTRTVMRRALETLENEGIIWRHVGKGTFVAETGTPLPETPGPAIDRQLTPVRAMRARLCLEPAIAREAAINASAEAIARLERAQARARAATSWKEYEACDDRFHRAVAEASDNILLVRLFDQMNQARRAVGWSHVVRDTARPSPDHRSFAEHDAILAAIAGRDAAGAQDAMRAHIGSVSARLFGDL